MLQRSLLVIFSTYFFTVIIGIYFFTWGPPEGGGHRHMPIVPRPLSAPGQWCKANKYNNKIRAPPLLLLCPMLAP